MPAVTELGIAAWTAIAAGGSGTASWAIPQRTASNAAESWREGTAAGEHEHPSPALDRRRHRGSSLDGKRPTSGRILSAVCNLDQGPSSDRTSGDLNTAGNGFGRWQRTREEHSETFDRAATSQQFSGVHSWGLPLLHAPSSLPHDDGLTQARHRPEAHLPGANQDPAGDRGRLNPSCRYPLRFQCRGCQEDSAPELLA
jgi:hypothetical protein